MHPRRIDSYGRQDHFSDKYAYMHYQERGVKVEVEVKVEAINNRTKEDGR